MGRAFLIVALLESLLRLASWFGDQCWHASRWINRRLHPAFVWIRKGAL